jgi:hypothetical protein
VSKILQIVLSALIQMISCRLRLLTALHLVMDRHSP